MAREIPEVVRAAAGLAATVLDEARKLPETLPGLPVRVIGLAMQQAMKVQQHYAGLVARGDELFTGLRGEDEPGLATFDDDLPAPVAPAAAQTGYRESAFDRAEVALPEVTITEDTSASAPAAAEKPDEKPAGKAAGKAGGAASGAAGRAAKPKNTRPKSAKPKAAKPRAGKPATPAPDAATPDAATPDAATPTVEQAAVEQAAAQVEDAQQTLDTLPAEAPGTDEVLEELAIEEMVGDAPAATAEPAAEAAEAAAEPAPESAPESAADVATPVDVLTPDGDVATVDAAVTDEGIAAPSAPETSAPAPESGSSALAPDSGSSAPAQAPVDGYDAFSVAQLRGRLRGYALSTVSDLIGYEEATRAREPYLRLLRNRLRKLEEQAVESSPLAPRGA